jgi:ketosteroid isomerase-like protein
MLRKLLLIATIGVLGACAPAPAPAPAAPPPPPDTSADEAKLRADLPKWFDDYNAGNAEGVASQYADDAVLMPPGAPSQTGRAAIRDFIAKDSAATKSAGLMLKNTAITAVVVTGDSAWMSGTFAVVDAKGATVDTGKYLSTHKRVNGAWPYVRDTWNSDNPPPPPPAKKGD